MGRIETDAAASPLGEMNTTPLIDVLLVLLVMLIITIPPQTHAVKFDLPQAPPPNVHIDHTSNLVVLKADGSIDWDGQPVSKLQLRHLLAASSQMDKAPELHLKPDADAKHGDVDELLLMIKQEQVRRFGFVGNERYRNIF